MCTLTPIPILVYLHHTKCDHVSDNTAPENLGFDNSPITSLVTCGNL